MASINPHSRKAVSVLVGTALIAIGARLHVAIPGTDVPQTAQTLAVLIVGIVLGPVCGTLSVVAYVVLGMAGLPIFAGASSGLEVLVGPTAGYLVGFVLAAALAGHWTTTRFAGRFGGAFAGMALAHAAILLLGWLRLAISLGPESAYSLGVAPFLIGAVVKSLIASPACTIVVRRRATRHATDEEP